MSKTRMGILHPLATENSLNRDEKKETCTEQVETSLKVSKKLSPTADRMVFYRLNPQEYIFSNVFLRDENSYLKI